MVCDRVLKCITKWYTLINKENRWEFLKLGYFNRWAKDEKISDATLNSAIEELKRGIVEANLGGHVYKKRIAIQGRGKSVGVRTIIAFKIDNHFYFMYGFAKNKQANISNDELKTFKTLASEFMSYDESVIENAIKEGVLYEVITDG